jgi:cytochrome P450
VFKGLLNVVAEVGGNKGRIGRLIMGPKVGHVVSHPEHVRYVLAQKSSNYVKGSTLNNLRLLVGEGLITSDGEVWRRERNIAQEQKSPQFGKETLQPRGELHLIRRRL